jgi:tetratricopeptide (TPR) repeat protein
MSNVFMSYVERDSELAEKIARGLEHRGFTTWYYERDSLPGTPWLTQVGIEIEEAGAVVLIISRRSLESKQVTSEIDYARSKGKPFVPVRFGVAQDDIEQLQRQWAFALGTAVSIAVPEGGPTSVFFTRLTKGLGLLGIRPGPKPAPGDNDLEEQLAEIRQIGSDPERGGSTEEALLAVVDQHPTSARAFRSLGQFYNRSFRPRDALKAFKKAAEIEPENALALWELGLACIHDGRSRDAASCLRRSLGVGLDPSRAERAKTLLRGLDDA